MHIQHVIRSPSHTSLNQSSYSRVWFLGYGNFSDRNVYLKPKKPRNYYQKANCIFNAALHGKSINLKTELAGDADRFVIENDGKSYSFAMCAPNPLCGDKGGNNFCMKKDENMTNLGKFQYVRYVDQTFTMVYSKGDQVGFQILLSHWSISFHQSD